MQKIFRFYLNWGIFEKGLGTLVFVKFFSICWLGSVPFDLCVFVLANFSNFNMYLGKFHSCSCIAHMLVLYVHTKCLIKCLNGILVLFWTLMSSKFWGLLWLNLFIMHCTCITYAHHMHTLAQLSIVLHFIDITCFSTYNMIVWHCFCSFLGLCACFID